MQVTITNGKETKKYETARKQTILALMQEKNIRGIDASCGGNGRCKKCTVEIEGRGECLACQTFVQDGMHIILNDEKLSAIAENGTIRNYFLPDAVESLVAACDIGTTTVVCHLIDGITGEILATKSEPNQQRIYGADVVSRIERAGTGQLPLLHQMIARQLDRMLEQLCKQCKRENKIERLAVAGNTVMCHLLVGMSPDSIGVAPFTPKEYFGKEYEGSQIGISCCRRVYVLDCAAGYVGADITADLLAEIPKESDEITLLLDIGTNGEMVLGSAKDGYICCATAAGPAFEGAEIEMGMPAADGAITEVWIAENSLKTRTVGDALATGICGSGLLDALAVMLETGLMDGTGMLLEKEAVKESYRCYLGSYHKQPCVWLTEKVCITQEDIRNLQLAKAAIAAGIEVLLSERKLKYKDVSRVLLAGGFGSYLKKESAAAIGLIPDALLPVTEAVGNAAGEGAVLAAVSQEARKQAGEIKAGMRHIELSMHPDFSDIYMDCISFESYRK